SRGQTGRPPAPALGWRPPRRPKPYDIRSATTTSQRSGLGERVAPRSHDVELHAVEQRVIVDRAGVGSASTKGLEGGLSRPCEVLVGDRREWQQLDLVD